MDRTEPDSRAAVARLPRAILIVAIATNAYRSTHMFETLAFLSTVGLIVIFVVLFQIDRAGRREEEEAGK